MHGSKQLTDLYFNIGLMLCIALIILEMNKDRLLRENYGFDCPDTSRRERFI